MENENVKVVIIDDEYPARRLLSEYVSKIPNWELCASFGDAMEAAPFVQSHAIDLILTDIQMPDLTGLEFVGSLKERPLVIFTTAYAEYALDSYELEAVDYLLKPISFPRFMQAVNKVGERLRIRRQVAETPRPEKDFFMVKADYKLYRIDYCNLLFVEGQSEYVTFHLKDRKKITAYYSLKKLEDELPSDLFLRIHKSYIVSLSNIESVEGNMLSIAGQKLSIGKNYRDELMRILNG